MEDQWKHARVRNLGTMSPLYVGDAHEASAMKYGHTTSGSSLLSGYSLECLPTYTSYKI